MLLDFSVTPKAWGRIGTVLTGQHWAMEMGHSLSQCALP
jgi:hypothetical protein